jgi:phosphoglycerate dehydrogenase-like enzyme
MQVLLAAYHRLDLWTAPEWFAERLRRQFPKLEVVHLTGNEGFDRQLVETDVLFSSSVKPEQVLAARQLRWIHSPAAAIHQFLFHELVDSDIVLTNAREVHGPVVAEHVIALMFAAAKRIPQAVRLQAKHLWGQEMLYVEHRTPEELAGATIGLVGLGSIGQNVARRAAALDMKVIAVREHPEKPKAEFVQRVLPVSQLNVMLALADYVVLSAPLTAVTRGMIGRQQMASMKPGAYLINVGRGPLLDEHALVLALREHKIAGAALDVFDIEPLPADSPLWDLDNLLITPHTAGMTERMWERHYALFAENLRRFIDGQPMLAVVDKRAGY